MRRNCKKCGKIKKLKMRKRSGPARIGHALFFLVTIAVTIYTYQGTILKIRLSTGFIVTLNYSKLLKKSYESSGKNIVLFKKSWQFYLILLRKLRITESKLSVCFAAVLGFTDGALSSSSMRAFSASSNGAVFTISSIM